jgi:Gas vesicle synthesis protein GvpL/GvpF
MSAGAPWASYTYAVARPFDPAQIAQVQGVDGSEVHLVSYQDIVAVVSSLSVAEFDEAAIRAKLATPEALEAVARAHHAVVEAVAARSVTLPFRLATIHHGGERVIEVLRQGYRRFCAALDRLAGCVEVGVKVYADLEALAATDPARKAGPAAPSTPSSPGRDYLRRRMEQRRSRDEAWRLALAAADRTTTTLAKLALDQRCHRPQDPRLSGTRGENVLNMAYLVDAADVQGFALVAGSLAALPGMRIEVTGPWAPYSFSLPDDGGDSSGRDDRWESK